MTNRKDIISGNVDIRTYFVKENKFKLRHVLLVNLLIWILINLNAVNSALDYLPVSKLMLSAQTRVRIAWIIKNSLQTEICNLDVQMHIHKF